MAGAGLDPNADEKHLALNRFTIPFRIAPERRPQVKEVLLYMSRDRGRSWQLQARTNPMQDGFAFQSQQDGPYWFNVALLDQNNRQEPFNIYTAPVGQKIVVDTTRPEAKLWANRNNQEVAIQWEIREDHPNINSLRLECRTQEMPQDQWIPIQVRPGLSGSGNFPSPSASGVQVRLHISDVAGNLTTVIAETNGSSAFGAVPSNLAAGSTPAPSPVGAMSTVQIGSSGYAPVPSPTPGPAPAPASNAFDNSPFGTASLNPSQVSPGGLTPTNATGIRPGTAETAAVPRANQKPIQFVNQRQATVEIELGKVGPSGIGSVEVWTTLDEGETWALASTETINSDNAVDPALMKPAATRYKVPVQLQREGAAQGYTLIAKSRAGLGRAAPARGEAPQIRLECDSTPPNVDLFSPVPDAEARNQLLLVWKATDKNLANQPIITLEWAEQPNGPWQKIGGGDLPNTGKYSWSVPQGTPHSVYLRISARDLAGNKGVAQTQQPILVDLSVPEVNILGVSQVK